MKPGLLGRAGTEVQHKGKGETRQGAGLVKKIASVSF